MSGPIKPSEVEWEKALSIPDVVFEVFNKLIVRGMSGGTSTVKQEEAMGLISEQTGCDHQEVFDRGWLDVEEAYRRVGWKVTYDKPGYNETYAATFRFVKKGK